MVKRLKQQLFMVTAVATKIAFSSNQRPPVSISIYAMRLPLYARLLHAHACTHTRARAHAAYSSASVSSCSSSSRRFRSLPRKSADHFFWCVKTFNVRRQCYCARTSVHIQCRAQPRLESTSGTCWSALMLVEGDGAPQQCPQVFRYKK